jgi:hypothetical protein
MDIRLTTGTLKLIAIEQDGGEAKILRSLLGGGEFSPVEVAQLLVKVATGQSRS